MANFRSTADHYSRKAKKEGYPARSVYKLEEMQKKFSLIPRGGNILDIGAAPGSWTLFVHRRLLGKSGRITAVDLKELFLLLPDRITVLQGDAFSPEIRQEIAALGPYDALISDASPSTTGNRIVDTARSASLAVSVLDLAQEVLKEKGNLAFKLFQGSSQQELLDRMRHMFQKIKVYKPKASRTDSFEIFLIGIGKF